MQQSSESSTGDVDHRRMILSLVTRGKVVNVNDGCTLATCEAVVSGFFSGITT